jgi:TatD DNase family protein
MATELIDTHCHIHFADYQLDPDEVIAAAKQDGVTKMILVGCRLEDSRGGIDMAARHDGVWAAIGLHPHEAKEYVDDTTTLQEFRDLASKPKVVAIGEIGLDYYYGHSSRDDQIMMLRFQLSVAQEYNLPVIFHIRGSKESNGKDVWKDFWPIYEEFSPRGVVHSFSATTEEMEAIVARNLLIGLNGIMTFTKDVDQLAAVKRAPLKNIVLETDAPFLTPSPFRGTICQPKHVATIATFLSDLRGEDITEFARVTTQNAKGLFNLV